MTGEAGSTDQRQSGQPRRGASFALEYEAAELLARQLGTALDQLRGEADGQRDRPPPIGQVVEAQGDTARLPGRVVEAKGDTARLPGRVVGAQGDTARLLARVVQVQGGTARLLGVAERAPDLHPTDQARPGASVLDRVHQAMLLFGRDRPEALGQLLVGQGIGRDPAFWGLAQALSALYPPDTDEKRWVDGVLARKRGLGL
jgi:hypothetical protein